MAKKKMEHGLLSVGQRISKVAQRWFLMEPLLFSMYCTQVLTENRRLNVAMRTGAGKIEYNPEILDCMGDRELDDRLKVEALRIVLKHPYLRQPFGARPEILYLASNMTILDAMGGPKAFCFQLVPKRIADTMPKGKTFEEYSGMLNRLIPPLPAMETVIESSVESEASEKSESSELSAKVQLWTEGASLWKEDSIMTVDINLIIRAVIVGPANGWGTLSGSFIECVKSSLVAPVNLANILKGFKKTILSQRRELTRMRPSRRYGFGQMGSRYAYSTRVLVALDVSGSVDSEMLSHMLGLINRIFKQGVEDIEVLQFDSELKGEPLPIRNAITSFKVLGRGGTNFQPVADFYMDHPEYDGLIYITDGYAPPPVIPLQYRRLPVTWIITDKDLIPSIAHGWKRAAPQISSHSLLPQYES